MASKIQIKRGLKEKLPTLAQGEPAFTTDTKEFFIGDGSSNIEFAKKVDLEKTNEKVLDLIYKSAGGTAAALTLEIPTLAELANGYSKTFIASANNGATATTINGKQLYKPNTKVAPNLIKGKAYTVWYDKTGDCFFIKASAEGNTIADHVLAGEIFSNDSDTGITGTMTNNGSITKTLSLNETYTIPEGYHNGNGTVKQNIPNNGVINKTLGVNETFYIPSGYTSGGTINQSIPTRGYSEITPGQGNQVIYANQFLTGDQVIFGDPDLIPSNIISTANIFGIQGSATAQSLGGKRMETGGVSDTWPNALVVNLGFKPELVLIFVSGDVVIANSSGSCKNYTGTSDSSLFNFNVHITDTGFTCDNPVGMNGTYTAIG